MDLRKLVLYPLVISLVMNLILMTGCNDGDTGYKEVTVTKGSITFSFDYPDTLWDSSNTTQNSFIYEWIFLSDSADDNQIGKIQYKKALVIRIWDITNEFFNAETVIDQTIEVLTTGNYPFEQVELLKRTNTMISGISGEMVHYNAVFPENANNNHLMSCHKLAFIYRDYIWAIDYNAYIELENEASAEFEHIVKSFQFLE